MVVVDDFLADNMRSLFLLGCLAAVAVASQNDEWVWRRDDELDRFDNARYQVNENPEDFDNKRPLTGFRPQNGGLYGPTSRPIVPPSYPGNNGNHARPDRLIVTIKRPTYIEGTDGEPVISGFPPSSIKDELRYRDYDVCKCSYSFDCPSDALKFGTCSRDKKFCCFNSRKHPAFVSGQPDEGRYPPYGGPPNKYGPATFVQSANHQDNRRPQGSYRPGNRYPGNYHFSGENENHYPRPYEQNYDYDLDLYARSLKRNHTDTDTDEKA